MNPSQRHHVEKLFAEWFEVRAIAKTSGTDGYHLSVFAEKFGGKCKKPRVQIAGLNIRLPQQTSRARIAVNLTIRRIENCSVESDLRCTKQVAAHKRDCRFNKIFVT